MLNWIVLNIYIKWIWHKITYKGWYAIKTQPTNQIKSWTRLIALPIALIPLGKVWIQLFSLQLWVIRRAGWVLQPRLGNLSRKRETLNSNLLKAASKKLSLCRILSARRGWSVHSYMLLNLWWTTSWFHMVSACIEICDYNFYFDSVIYIKSGGRGVMVIIVGNGHGDASSSPGRG